MIIEPGSKVLIVNRRLFENDKPRYFVGTVDTFESPFAKVTGHTWVIDSFNGRFLRKEDPRTKIIALQSAGILVYCLPGKVNLSEVRFDYAANGEIILRDNAMFRMDLSENFHGK